MNPFSNKMLRVCCKYQEVQSIQQNLEVQDKSDVLVIQGTQDNQMVQFKLNVFGFQDTKTS